MMNINATINDYKRDSAIPLPEGITECRNISYGSHGKWNLLDVYYPDGTAAPCLPSFPFMAAAMCMARKKSTAVTVWIWPAAASRL